jgi:hypothetical protein
VYAITDQPKKVEAAVKKHNKKCAVIKTKARNKGAEISKSGLRRVTKSGLRRGHNR